MSEGTNNRNKNNTKMSIYYIINIHIVPFYKKIFAGTNIREISEMTLFLVIYTEI